MENVNIIGQLRKKMTEETEFNSVEDALIQYAKEMAKASLEIYFSEGMEEEDYSYAYQSLSQALLYFQRKRKRPEE